MLTDDERASFTYRLTLKGLTPMQVRDTLAEAEATRAGATGPQLEALRMKHLVARVAELMVRKARRARARDRDL